MTGKPVVNKELEGFEIGINSFGEIQQSFPIDKLNTFLDRYTDDKKLTHLNEDEPESEESESEKPDKK